MTDFLCEVRPAQKTQFERQFETPPGKQAQVDFAVFTVDFTDEPGIVRKVWLFSMVPATAAGAAHSCLLCARIRAQRL